MRITGWKRADMDISLRVTPGQARKAGYALAESAREWARMGLDVGGWVAYVLMLPEGCQLGACATLMGPIRVCQLGRVVWDSRVYSRGLGA